MNKKNLIGMLYYELSKQDPDFKLAIAWKDSNGDVYWSKHKTFLECCNDDDFLEKCNNRTILRCEIVLDVDCQTIEEANFKRQLISDKLKSDMIPFKCYFTGSRGYHFHIIKPEWSLLPSKDREYIRTELIKRFFNVDGMKAYDKSMIAMENCPHWKTGKIKELIEEWTP